MSFAAFARAVVFLIIMLGAQVRAGLGEAGTTIPFTYYDNRMLIQCRVNGEGPLWMILDTGTPTFALSTDTARRLKLSVRNNGTVTGGGNGASQLGAAKLRTISIGALTLKNVDTDVIDLSVIRAKFHFPHMDGIVGYPLLERYVTFVNADAGTVTFASAPPPEPPQAKTTSFNGILPIVTASIDGIPTSVLVDTGDRSSLTIFAPFAKRHAFYGKYPSQTNVLTGYGVGGPIYGDVFTLPALDVLGTSFQGVVARASRATGGAFASAGQGGSIGTGILKRFNVVYDYRRKTIVSWPSKYFGDPFRFVPP